MQVFHILKQGLDWVLQRAFLFAAFYVLWLWSVQIQNHSIPPSYWLLLGLFLGLALVFFLIHFFIFKPMLIDEKKIQKRLLKSGVEVMAEIISVRQTNSYLNHMPIMEYGLRYVLDGKTHETRIKQPVSFVQLADVQVGRRHKAWVDPMKVSCIRLQEVD